ncbi:MAG: serine hydrolase [Firmicutes bacterium]|uniref:Serine hydrolase n=1 Tax=Candidatus Gallilactobacillus intestinavium TaxID=2840838 RepID=A0A9D9E8G6_9LACO|nr:serine hydrolase [Candidatus Gallilactobacillus intestinavium]
MLTAAAILHLVDQGKLKLSTPISQYYSSLATSNKVTVQSLLNMTSGLSNDSVPSSQLANVLNWNINPAEAGSVGQYNYQEINYVLLEGSHKSIISRLYYQYVLETKWIE